MCGGRGLGEGFEALVSSACPCLLWEDYNLCLHLTKVTLDTSLLKEKTVLGFRSKDEVRF